MASGGWGVGDGEWGMGSIAGGRQFRIDWSDVSDMSDMSDMSDKRA